MTPDQDDSTGSYDPRSWARRPPGEGEEAAPGAAPTSPPASDSFDPRSWTDRPAASPRLETVPPVAGDRSSPAARRSRAILAAGAAAALLLGIGGTIAYLSREDEPAAISAGPEQPEEGAPQAAAIPTSRLTLTLSDPAQIREVLTGAGVAGDEAGQASGLAERTLAAGEILLAVDTQEADGVRRVVRLEATQPDGSGVLVTRGADGQLAAKALQARLASQIFVRRGEMDTTDFYSSAVAAGITDSLISDFAKALAFDFDFQQEISPGDVFEGAFEQDVNPSGRPVGEPRLIYVSLVTEEKSRRFYRFKAPGEDEAGWFDDNGRSTVRALMRTPVDGARVTSKFGYRVHPILKYQKLHRGTDFGAPTGTPVFAAGSGVVQVASMRGAAGNMVRLLHDNGWITHYFHLNQFAPGLALGKRVSQGQTIGEVGTTGRSTGPHLHYEVFIDGEPVDPLSIDTGTGVTLEGPALEAFKRERDRIDLSRSQQND